MMQYGREFTMNDNILKKFVDIINERGRTDELFDITSILSNKQEKKFERMQGMMSKLFSANNLAEGLEQVANDKLTEDEQISILMIMKLVENMMSEVESSVSDIPSSYGMYH